MAKVKLTKKQLYSLSLKLIALLGLVIIMAVMINSLWGEKGIGGAKNTKPKKQVASSVHIPLQDLKQGSMKRIAFNGKSVAVLYRSEAEMEKYSGSGDGELNGDWRSIKPEYFVFINSAGQTRCPLHLSADATVLKDICTGIKYDSTGISEVGGNKPLVIPPHYFSEEGGLYIGAWNSASSN